MSPMAEDDEGGSRRFRLRRQAMARSGSGCCVGAVYKGVDLLAWGKPQGLRKLQAAFACVKLEEHKTPLAEKAARSQRCH